MNKRVRWGVMGNATIARVCVIPAIQKSRNGTVVALATRSPETAQEVVRQNGIPRLYDSYATLLKDPGIDAVYVPLPNHLHRPWTLAALAAGKPVLCEKPLALSAAEADEMSRAAAASGLPLMEALITRIMMKFADCRIRSPGWSMRQIPSSTMCANICRAVISCRLKGSIWKSL